MIKSCRSSWEGGSESSIKGFREGLKGTGSNHLFSYNFRVSMHSLYNLNANHIREYYFVIILYIPQ